MKVKTKELQTAFAVCDAVKADPALDCSQFVRISQDAKELTLALTGALRAGSKLKAAEGNGKSTTYVDRRLLRAFLNTATGADIELLVKNDKLVLKAGHRLEAASHAPISGYEAWVPKSTFDLTAKQKQALKTAARYLPTVAGTENVAAVYFEAGYGVVVTDTLVMMGLLGTSLANTFYVPNEMAAVISSNTGSLGTDKNGIGIAMQEGFVYQTLSTKLSGYPVGRCKANLDEAKTAAALCSVGVSPLLESLRVASQFLVDKAETAIVESKNGSIHLSIESGAAKFGRTIPTTGGTNGLPAVKWPLKQILPWLVYVQAIKDDAEIAICKTQNASAFRFTEGKLFHLFLTVDL